MNNKIDFNEKKAEKEGLIWEWDILIQMWFSDGTTGFCEKEYVTDCEFIDRPLKRKIFEECKAELEKEYDNLIGAVITNIQPMPIPHTYSFLEE
jgi:hypothetical protein